MRGAFLVCVVAAVDCAQPVATPTIDAGSADVAQIKLTILADAFVARGQSVTALIAGNESIPLTIDLVSLPPGVTATSSPTDANGLAKIVVTAASDAPLCDVFALAIARDDSGVRGTGSFRVAVIDVDGSLDPTFGEAGVAQLPAGVHLAGITMTYDGHLLAAAETPNGQCSLIQLAADGSVDGTFGENGAIVIGAFSKSTCVALATDLAGNAAILLQPLEPPQAPVALVRIDASGVVSAATDLDEGSSVGWTGSEWLVLGHNSVVAVNTSGQAFRTIIPFTLANSFAGGVVTPSGEALLVGALGSSTTMASAVELVPGASDAYAIDASFGTNGRAQLGPTAQLATAAVADGAGGFIVGVDGAIEHVLSDGSYDPQFAGTGAMLFATSKVTALVSMPSGDFIAFGDAVLETGMVRFRSNGDRVATFGAFGFSATNVLNNTYEPSTAYDGNGHLYVSDWLGLVRFRVSP